MARLITHHDPYHIHKILGLLVLLHFAMRLIMLFSTGSAFPDWGHGRGLDVAGVLLHGLLSLSSLLLPLPQKRNMSAPMIWPEFRLHSIVFASRHVIATVVTLLDAWPSSLGARMAAQWALLRGTSFLASEITDRYGSREQRTTNSMPYPKGFEARNEAMFKEQYMGAQFGATAFAIGGDVTMAWISLLGIQLAPLLMTLVRKGKVSAKTYHLTYGWGLLMGYVACAVRMIAIVLYNEHPSEAWRLILTAALITTFIQARVDFNLSPLAIWTAYVAFYNLGSVAIMQLDVLYSATPYLVLTLSVPIAKRVRALARLFAVPSSSAGRTNQAAAAAAASSHSSTVGRGSDASSSPKKPSTRTFWPLRWMQ